MEDINVKKESLNRPYEMVREFHKAFGITCKDEPEALSIHEALARANFIGEELLEFLYASVAGDVDQFKAFARLFYAGLLETENRIIEKQDPIEDVLVAQADAFTDINYFNQGNFTLIGVKPFSLFQIVHEANMGKLWEDGKPRYRNDGKIIKPPHWQDEFAPEERIKQEISRQKEGEKRSN